MSSIDPSVLEGEDLSRALSLAESHMIDVLEVLNHKREELKHSAGIQDVADIARHLKSVRTAIEDVQRERGRIADHRRKIAEAGRSCDIDFETVRSQIRRQLDCIRNA